MDHEQECKYWMLLDCHAVRSSTWSKLYSCTMWDGGLMNSHRVDIVGIDVGGNESSPFTSTHCESGGCCCYSSPPRDVFSSLENGSIELQHIDRVRPTEPERLKQNESQ
eukprot:scaffold231301_cov63-Cyclotella_meneghiniana.AAC.4